MKDYFLKLFPERKQRCLKTAKLICERCENEFSVPFWMIKKGRRYCSDKCRRNHDPIKMLLSRSERQPNGCLNFTGVIDTGGYGQVKFKGRCYGTHKLMWMVHNKKKVPKGKVVRHTCIANRKCMEPSHLIVGTQKQNIQDCIRQGRFRIAVGVERRCAYLTMQQVKEIRALRPMGVTDAPKSLTYKALGRQFGVAAPIIWQVVNHKTYKENGKCLLTKTATVD